MGGSVLGPRLRRDAAPRELHEDLGGGVEEAREPRRRARRAAVALVAVASVIAVERRFVYGVGLSAKEPLERVRRVARERPRRRGVERVEEPRRRKLMERVVEALGDAGRAGRVVRVSDQEARGRALRASAAAEARCCRETMAAQSAVMPARVARNASSGSFRLGASSCRATPTTAVAWAAMPGPGAQA